jgi:ribulose-phosphate 3-epimerase
LGSGSGSDAGPRGRRSRTRIRIAPSILAADYAELAAEIDRVASEADMVHVDIMDGHFVPNLTIGPPVVAAIRRHTSCHLDCHLMVDRPMDLLEPLAEAGADGCSVHVELGDPSALIARMRELGLRPGLVVNPATPIEAALPHLDAIDLLLVMSVVPGRGGQRFIPDVLPKVAIVRRLVDQRGLEVDVQIDGGINPETAPLAAAAGADVLVAGSAIYGTPDPPAAARRIREAALAALSAGPS